MSGTCIVTGAGGYVGSALVRFLRGRGLTVREMRRPAPGNTDQQERPDGEPIPFRLGEDVDPAPLRGCDFLVHCAWDFRVRSRDDIARVNVAGSLELFRAARSAGVGRLVFISTMSAFDGCVSSYGRSKLEVEVQAAGADLQALRPGLVWGPSPGGMVGALAKLARLPVIPLPGLGRQVLCLTHEEDLGELVLGLGQGRIAVQARPITAAAEEGLAFKQILRLLAGRAGKRPLLLPVPWRLPWFGLRSLEAIGFAPRMRSDSLLSLVNQDPNPDFEATRAAGVRFRPFAEGP